MDQGPRHPLVTIRFEDGDERNPIAYRFWHHVPMIGDIVDLGKEGRGAVRQVTWTDDIVIVNLREMP
jgi:hypothetical protein